MRPCAHSFRQSVFAEGKGSEKQAAVLRRASKDSRECRVFRGMWLFGLRIHNCDLRDGGFFLGSGDCLCRDWGRRREGPRCRRVDGQIETDLARARRGFSRQHMSDIARGIAQNLPGLPPVR